MKVKTHLNREPFFISRKQYFKMRYTTNIDVHQSETTEIDSESPCCKEVETKNPR